MRYVHTNIITRNWKKLSQFYIDVFNCEVIPPIRNQSGEWLSRGTGVKNAHLEGVHLKLPGYGKDGPTLEIYSYSQMEDNLKQVSNRLGIGHLAFEVQDVEEVLNNAIQHGATQYGEVVDQNIYGKGKITFTYLKDPDGNIIEIQHWD